MQLACSLQVGDSTCNARPGSCYMLACLHVAGAPAGGVHNRQTCVGLFDDRPLRDWYAIHPCARAHGRDAVCGSVSLHVRTYWLLHYRTRDSDASISDNLAPLTTARHVQHVTLSSSLE